MWLEIIKKLSKVVGKKVAPNAQLPGTLSLERCMGIQGEEKKQGQGHHLPKGGHHMLGMFKNESVYE